MPYCTVHRCIHLTMLSFVKGECFKKISLENLLNLEADFSFASWFCREFSTWSFHTILVLKKKNSTAKSTTECTRNDRNWIVPILVNNNISNNTNNNISNNTNNKNISHNYINSNYHRDNNTVDDNYDDK
jgi:hypothetical protein